MINLRVLLKFGRGFIINIYIFFKRKKTKYEKNLLHVPQNFEIKFVFLISSLFFTFIVHGN